MFNYNLQSMEGAIDAGRGIRETWDDRNSEQNNSEQDKSSQTAEVQALVDAGKTQEALVLIEKYGLDPAMFGLAGQQLNQGMTIESALGGSQPSFGPAPSLGGSLGAM